VLLALYMGLRVFLYRLKKALKTFFRPLYHLLRRTPRVIKLTAARILYFMLPSVSRFGAEQLYPPQRICRSTSEWMVQAGKRLGSEFYPVAPACDVHNPLPKTAHAGIRRQFKMDQVYPCPENFVVSIKNGRVWHNGLIVSPDDQFLSDISVDFRSKNGRPAISRFWELLPLKEYSGTVAVLTTDAADLYYHWLFQLLPRFELMRLAGLDLSAVDYFAINGLAKPFQRESMELLKIEPKKIIETRLVPYFRAEKLIVPSIALSGGCFPAWMCKFLRRTFLVQDPGRHDRRIYIGRGQTAYRRVLNEPEVIRCLERRGFEAMNFDGMSMRDQATVVASCQAIVAPHGGGLSNLVFGSPGTKVIEMFSPELVASFYWKISNQMGLDYYYMLGKGSLASQDADYDQSWDTHADIDVDIKLLEQTLDIAGVF
jgi:hypothetical protein